MSPLKKIFVILVSLSLITVAARAQNLTFTTISRTPLVQPGQDISITTPLVTSSGVPCCIILLSGVFIGEWWDTTYAATVATVTTRYIEYNNLTRTSLETYHDTETIKYWDLGIEYESFTDLTYGHYYFSTGITCRLPLMIEPPRTSPLGFYHVKLLSTFRGTSSSDRCGSISWNPESHHVDIYITATISSLITREINNIPFEPGLKSIILSQLQEEGADTESLLSCSIVPGVGEPIIHVPVNALTEHISTTITGQVMETSYTKTSHASLSTVKPLPQPTPLPSQTSMQAVPPTFISNNPKSSRADYISMPLASRTDTVATSLPLAQEPARSEENTLQQHPDVRTFPPSVLAGTEVFYQAVNTDSSKYPSLPSAVVIGTEIIPVLSRTNGPGLILPGDTILAPGMVLTYESQVLSLGYSGAEIFVLGSGLTSTIPLFVPAATDYDLVTTVSVGSLQYTFTYATGTEGGIRLPNGATILPGSTTTVDGTVLYFASSATEIVIGSKTVPLAPVIETAKTGDGAGSYIWHGLGGGQATSSPAQFTGSGSREIVNCLHLICCGVVGLVFQFIF
ncbi:hypothetical protein BS50DRAFT_618795 [Corynespora cassiicola Philippines]|uniref:Uncharacterized protein n=1 Tax=Corynespora cassiicola Philippines TaxID=1448308 RepID=A0A2T2NWL4_CORCC|nr:hypothetical protein BS50DRAFT_618795 [Corynespora cassiicola Philippines]